MVYLSYFTDLCHHTFLANPTLRAACLSVQPVRLRQEWMAPHFIRRGFYTVVASTAGRADHQEWIATRSIAQCGLDSIASSHQDPVCKPCAHSPLHRPQRRYTAHCGRLRYPARYRSLIARCPLRSSATLALNLVTPRSLRYLAPLLHVTRRNV